MSKVLFFKEFGTHSFKIINLDKDDKEQIDSVLGKEHAQFPTLLHYTTARGKYGRKAEQQKGCTQQNDINDFVGFLLFFFFVRFSSNKSLSTPYFFLMVKKNTLMVSQRHSIDLE